MKKYFFDITDIVIYIEKETSISGIQRVSFEIIKRMIGRHGAEKVLLSYWDRSKKQYFAIPSKFLINMDEFDPYILGSVFFGKDARSRNETAPTLERYRNHPLKYRFHYFKRKYHALRKNEIYFKKKGSSLAQWREFHNKSRRQSAGSIHSDVHDIGRMLVSDIATKDDKLIILGATWAISGIDECFYCLHQESGLDVTLLVHDLIPLITPEHIAGDFSQEFFRWLSMSTNYCGQYIANSQNTANDLKKFMEEIGVGKPIECIPLAQDFSIKSVKFKDKLAQHDLNEVGFYRKRVEKTMFLRRDILNLSKTPFVLVVGTMESRKNIWRLLQVWQRLSKEPGLNPPKLVFAGKPGWQNEDFKMCLRATGNLGGWVQIADRPTDVELAFLYETCVFTAMVSFYEGWGLPIGEGLAFGKTAVVADNSSMPEVGGDMVEYCDAHSIDSIQSACRKLIENTDYRKALECKIRETRLRSWEDVTSDFVEVLSY